VFFTTPVAKDAGGPPLGRQASAGRVDCTATHVVYWGRHLFKGVGPLRKVICVVTAAMAVLFSLSDDASADGMSVKQHARKVATHNSVVRPTCPDPYSCSPLYGAYGPYGGAAYWTRYTYAGWYR
jgi:hypothetical protein